MIKAVLFDLDNTLVDFMRMKREASRAAAYAMVEAGFKADPRKLSKRLFDFYLKHGIESDDAFEVFLRSELGVVNYRILTAAVNAYVREKYLQLKPYPGVKKTLEKLGKKGLRLGVVSDGLRIKAWMRLNAAGLDKYFNTVVTYEDTGVKKPAKEPFLKACRELYVKPQECLMVGDWPDKDVEGAKTLGMKTCWAKYGSIMKKAKSDYKIKEIGELPDIIKNHGTRIRLSRKSSTTPSSRRRSCGV